MKLYLAAGREWVGTQADAKAIDKTFATIEVPTDKEGLMGFLNKLQTKIHTLREERDDARAGVTPAAMSEEQPQISDTPEFVEEFQAPVEPVVEAPKREAKSLLGQDVVDVILASEGIWFGHYLEASITRLGELRATGWNELRKLVRSEARSRTSLERGLGYIVLDGVRAGEGDE